MKKLFAAPLLALALVGQHAIASENVVETSAPEQAEVGHEILDYGFQELTSEDEIEVSEDFSPDFMSLSGGRWVAISCTGKYQGMNVCRMPGGQRILQAQVQSTTCGRGAWGWDAGRVWVTNNCSLTIAVYLVQHVPMPRLPRQDDWRRPGHIGGIHCRFGRDDDGWRFRRCSTFPGRWNRDDDDDRRRRRTTPRKPRRNNDDDDNGRKGRKGRKKNKKN